MEDLKLMMAVKDLRTNDFFRQVCFDKIYIAYNIKAILDPDNEFGMPINNFVKTLILKGDFSAAARMAVKDVSTIDSSYIIEEMVDEAEELISTLYANFLEKKADDRDKRKIELLAELAKLDQEV